jgi:hypothetical protein
MSIDEVTVSPIYEILQIVECLNGRPQHKASLSSIIAKFCCRNLVFRIPETALAKPYA